MATYLFLGQSCDPVLPAAAIVDVYRIAVILPAKATLGDITSRLILRPNLILGPDPNRPRLSTLLDEQGGVRIDALADGEGDTLLAPAVTVVADVDPFEVVATGSVEIDGEPLAVQLTPHITAALLSGRAARVSTRGEAPRQFLLQPRDDDDAQHIPSTVPVANVAAFAADPALTDLRGQRVAFKFSATQLKHLVEYGSASLQIKGKTVVVCYSPCPDMAAQSSSQQASQIEDVTRKGSALTIGTVNLQVADASGDAISAAASTATPPPPASRPAPALSVALVALGEQRWTQLGHARGELVHSLVLAPLEETTLEVYSWDRRTVSQTEEDTAESESTLEASRNNRLTGDVMMEMSRNRDVTNSLGGTLSLSVPNVPVNVSLSASTNEATRLANSVKQSTQWVAETTLKTSARFKATRQVKVSQTSEFGTERRVTRRLRNPNTGHTLAIDAFELVAGYTVRTAFARSGVRLCALVPIAPATAVFTRDEVRLHETTLRAHLLDPTLADAFASARFLAARSRYCDAARDSCTASNPVDSTLQALKAHFQTLLQSSPDDWLYANCDDPNPHPSHRAIPADSGVQSARLWLYGVALSAALPQVVEWLQRGASGRLPVDATALDAIKPKALSDAYRELINGRLDERRRQLGLVLPDRGTYISVLALEWNLYDLVDGGLVPALQSTAATPAATAPDLQAAFAPAAVAAALEREEVLLRHLNLHRGRYRLAIWQSAPLHERRHLLPWLDAQTWEWLEEEPIAADGESLAFPIRVARHLAIASYIEQMIHNNPQLDQSTETEVELPTGSVVIETRLGRCDGTEPALRAQQAAQTEHLRAEAQRLVSERGINDVEAKRRALLLKQNPPVLTPQDRAPIDLRILRDESSPR